MNLRSVPLVAALFTFLCVGAFLFAATDAPDGDQASSKAIKQLIDRIEKLEARVDELDQRPELPFQLRPNVLGGQFVPPASAERSVPKGWQRHEFNGHHFYTVPLEGSSQPPAPMAN